MDTTNKFLNDPDFFEFITAEIDKKISNIMEIIEHINLMTVESSQLERELMLALDSKSWANVAPFIGHTPQKTIAIDVKKEH